MLKLRTLTYSQYLIQAKDLCAWIKGTAVYKSGSDAPRKQSCKGKGRPGFALFLTLN